MLKKSNLLLFSFLLAFQSSASAQDPIVDCMQTEAALEYWRPIRETVQDGNHTADDLAETLLPCLASPNSELRDRIGYELLTYWLRNDSFSQQTKINLFIVLSANLSIPDVEVSFKRSFSALILSEVLRADNLDSFLSSEQRVGLTHQTLDALTNEADFRGLTEEFGWVHPIAHMADVLWRTALHKGLTEDEARSILSGVANKAGADAASYGFNEGDRLARVVSVIIAREVLTSEEVVAWLSNFDTPSSMDSWFDAFASVEGMNELHNTKLFIRALSDQLQNEDLNSDLRKKLDELVAMFTAIV